MTAARVGPGAIPFGTWPAPGSSSAAGRGGLPCRGGAFVLARIEQLDGSARHHGADRVLIDELRMPIATKQDGKIIEPGDNALELHAIDQKYGHGRLVLSHM